MRLATIAAVAALMVMVAFPGQGEAFKLFWGVDEKGPAQKKAEQKNEEGKEAKKETLADKHSDEENAPAEKAPEKPAAPVAKEKTATVEGNTVLFPASVEKVWNATLEILLPVPLSSVDRSSGIIITEWLYGQKKGGGVAVFDPLGNSKERTRIRYTVQVRPAGNGAEVRIFPHFQAIKSGRGWGSEEAPEGVAAALIEKIRANL